MKITGKTAAAIEGVTGRHYGSFLARHHPGNAHRAAEPQEAKAIFLSTFVMIGQNRQAEFAQRKADHDFTEQEQELKLNTQLTQAIHELAKEIHGHICTPHDLPA